MKKGDNPLEPLMRLAWVLRCAKCNAVEFVTTPDDSGKAAFEFMDRGWFDVITANGRVAYCPGCSKEM